MPVGIESYDQQGRTMFSATTSVVKLLGSFGVGESYTGSQQQGVVYHNGLLLALHTPFYDIETGVQDENGHDVNVSISGNELFWWFPLERRPNATIKYGVF